MLIYKPILNAESLYRRVLQDLHAFGRAFSDITFEIEQESEEAVKKSGRSVSGIANVEEISRSGILVRMDGLDIRGFQKNPVVLAGHRDMFPDGTPAVIALAHSIKKEKDRLLFKSMEFDTDPMSEVWLQKVRTRHVRMLSIGFIPTKVEFAEEEHGKGENKKTVRFLDILESELLEISVVAIGANRGSFIDPASIPQGENLDSLIGQVESLTAQVESLRSIVHGENLELDEPSSDGEAFGDASFPDAAFIVEKGAPKEGDRTPQKFRHLPHHRRSVKNGTENGSVDIPHLRNALARVNQVKPVLEAADSYKRRAKAHLQSHARALLKSAKDQAAVLEQSLAESGYADPGNVDMLLGQASKLNELLAV